MYMNNCMNPDIKRYGLALFLICLGLTGTANLAARTVSAPPRYKTAALTPETYIRAARASLEQNDPIAARTATERYFQTATDTAAERLEMATILKWALLTSGQLNEDFLTYGHIPEMGLMLPVSFPAMRIAKPYSCLTMACGLYVPALSTMICATDRNGLDLFSTRLLTEICIETGRLSLARRYIAHLPKAEQGEWYRKAKEHRQALWAWDSLPYHLASEPATTDAWVCFFYPSDSAERTALALKPTQARCLLDYYTLLQLLHKRLDLLPAITEAYRAQGAARLPAYVQEAWLLAMNYLNGGFSKDEVLQWRKGDLKIEPDIIARFERLVYDFNALRNGTDNWNEIRKNYRDTYAFYFIFDGIAF